MSMGNTARRFQRTLQLPEVLDVNATAPLAGELLSYRGNDLLADASRVQRVGGQAIQVLMSARMTWERDGMKLRVVNPSPAFRDVVGVLGIGDGELLDKEEVA
jgi:chemotaxis protein CheX